MVATRGTLKQPGNMYTSVRTADGNIMYNYYITSILRVIKKIRKLTSVNVINERAREDRAWERHELEGCDRAGE